MDNDDTELQSWIAPYSSISTIVMYWSAMLGFLFWLDHPHAVDALPATAVSNWGRGFGGMIVCVVVCLAVVVAGYYSLLLARAVDRSLVERALAGLRALLFLIPPVVFICASIICITMYLGLFPHQATGYSPLYTSAFFAWHYFLWLVPGVAEYLFPIKAMITHTSAATEMMAQMCRAAAFVTLIGAVIPALGRDRSYEPA